MPDFPATPNQVATNDGWNYSTGQIDSEWSDIASKLDDLKGLGLDDDAIAEAGEATGAIGLGLPSLGDLMYALVLFILIWAANWLLTELAKLTNDISFFGWHPFSFLASSAEKAGEDLQNTLDGVILRVRNAMVDVFHMISAVFQRLYNALNHHQNMIHQLNNNVVPAAQSSAVSQSEQYTNQQAVNLQNNINTDRNLEQDDVHNLQSNINALQDYLNGSFKSGVEDDIRTAEGDAESYSHAQLVQVETDLVNRLAGDEATIAGLQTAVSVTLPAEITQQVQASYNKEQGNLVAVAQNLQTQLTNIQDEINAINARISADEQVIAANQKAIAELQTDVQANATAIAAAQQAITTAEDDIATNTQELGNLTQQLTTTQGQLKTTTDATTLNAAQDALAGVAAGATIATAVATIGGNLQNLQTEFDQCAVTQCEGPNNIENVLERLLAGLVTLSELAFLADAVKNPVPTANALSPLLTYLDNTAVSTWDDIINLV